MVAGQRDESERLLIAHMHGSYDAAIRYRTRITELEAENTRLKAELAVREGLLKLAIEAIREIAQAAPNW